MKEERVKQFDIHLDEVRILQRLRLSEGEFAWEEARRIFRKLLPQIMEAARPRAALAFSTLSEQDCGSFLPGTPVLFAVLTAGEEIGRIAEACFLKGSGFEGLMADAMADEYLFAMDENLEGKISKMCREEGYGILSREEPPGRLPIEIHKEALRAVKAEETLGIGLTEGLMFHPVKTMCQVYILEKGCLEYRTGHDCSRCSAVSCHMKKQPAVVTVRERKKELSGSGNSYEIICNEGQSILDALVSAGVAVSAVCGKRGTCGKCKIRLLEGELEPSVQEKAFFSEEEIELGYRLACMSHPSNNCIVSEEFYHEQDMDVVLGKDEAATDEKMQETGVYAAAIDIGTTTIAMELVELGSKTTIDTYACQNHQRAYGADVITRAFASNESQKNKAALMSCIRSQLAKGLLSMCPDNGKMPVRLAIAGNTVMIHLLMGYSCEGLGAYPFAPVNLNQIEGDSGDLLGMQFHGIPYTIFPAISAFVGGDITAGLFACGMGNGKDLRLFLDLGTNGEMVLGNEERFLAASTAVGPAFEGGGISCGVGSIPGAVSHVRVMGRRISLETIRNKPAIGLCGSGVIDTVAAMLSCGAVDSTGELKPIYGKDGFYLGMDERKCPVYFTQQDVRAVQLAKAAVRAGIETLLAKYQVSAKEIGTVYAAGGFGCKMDMEKAVAIGLLPDEFRGKMKAVGNSVLDGLVQYLYLISGGDEEAKALPMNLAGRVTEVLLSNEDAFQQYYLSQMQF